MVWVPGLSIPTMAHISLGGPWAGHDTAQVQVWDWCRAGDRILVMLRFTPTPPLWYPTDLTWQLGSHPLPTIGIIYLQSAVVFLFIIGITNFAKILNVNCTIWTFTLCLQSQ